MAEEWIKGAIKRPGALRRKAGVKEGEKIPGEKLEELAGSRDKRTRAQARLAKTLKKLRG